MIIFQILYIFHGQLIYDHSNNQPMVTTHLWLSPLDLDLTPACGKPPDPGVKSDLPITHIEQLVPL